MNENDRRGSWQSSRDGHQSRNMVQPVQLYQDPRPAGSPEKTCGGILDLRTALDEYPDYGIVIYNRSSGRHLAGASKRKLKKRTELIEEEVRDILDMSGDLDRMVWDQIFGVERGKMSCPRPALEQAGQLASEHCCILVTSDSSRIIRAETYDHILNWDAWPEPQEFQLAHERTFGVPLATLADPLMSESQRRSLAIRRSKGGRPRNKNLRAIVWGSIKMLEVNDSGRLICCVPSMRDLAKRFGVGLGTISRIVREGRF